jgi:antitoxin YefM
LYCNKGGFMRTANYTDLRANLKSYIDAVIDDYDTVVVNRGNGKGVVMISLDEYNSLKETEYIMSSPDTMEAIHKGEEDIKNGNSISQNEGESIEDFLKRAACTE